MTDINQLLFFRSPQTRKEKQSEANIQPMSSLVNKWFFICGKSAIFLGARRGQSRTGKIAPSYPLE